MESTERQQSLASFLRTRRERLSPAEAGVHKGLRRRTPGLRREEVAQLAHIGVAWYTALEQGRNVRPSEQVLESLAQALRLTADERRHLFLLALHHDPIGSDAVAEEIPPALEELVRALHPMPAYVMGRRWDVLMLNPAAELVLNFADWPAPHTRNFVWRFFNYGGTPGRDWATWRQVAQGLAAQFRADSARYPSEPAFETLIGDLLEASDDFRHYWSLYDVRDTPAWHNKMTHPQLGQLDFENVSMHPTGNRDLRLVVYLPNAVTARKLAQALQG
jgi:transcriptional regulator with XRE-family HTH domain